MQRTRIKICGITRPQDAVAAANSGADAIGLVFYKLTPRCVSIEQAREILAVLPPFVTPVALFVNATVMEIRQTTDVLGLRYVQLHGHESPEVVDALSAHIVLKALRVSRDTFFKAELEDWRRAIASRDLTNLRGMVLESATAKGIGGTGVENDWDYIADLQLAGAFSGLPPIIAAGGLTPANVARVVRDLRPCAVDVSSGVEDAPGQKSVERIEAFVREVQSAL